MANEVVNLVPPLTPAQLEKNNEFQTQMRERFTLSGAAPNAYSVRVAADLLNIIAIIQTQFDTEKNEETKAILTWKAHQLKIEACQWLKSAGQFALAASNAVTEAEQLLYQAYDDAETDDDGNWCEHPRWKMNEDEKLVPNYYREFDYFSPRRGKLTSMTKCSECDTRNAVDLPSDLADLDKKREIELAKFKNK